MPRHYVNTSICEGVAGVDIWEPLERGSPEYKRIHVLLDKMYGRAWKQKCIQCGESADAHAWQHGANPHLVTNYEPMCNSCHAMYDYTDKQRAAVISNTNTLGYKHTPEACAKISTNQIGSRNHRSIINEKIAIEIRAMYCDGYTIRDIAYIFDIHRNVVYKVITRRTWRHV